MHLFRRLALEPPFQWKILGALQAVLSIWLIHQTQHIPSITLLAVVVWGGALICVETELEHFQIRPSLWSLFGGIGLLFFTGWRSSRIFDYDSAVYILPFLQGIGLVMLARPISSLYRFKDSIFILSLFPLQIMVSKVVPEYYLSIATGKLSQVILLIFGIQSSLAGRDLGLSYSSVRIAGSCNGVDLIVQLALVAFIFILAFPVRSTWHKLLFVGCSPLLGFAINAIRISILAIVNNSEVPFKSQVFDFLHEEWGGLFFAGFATLLMGQLYMAIINHELRDRDA